MSDPSLVLIHGLGATSGVWAGLETELAWPGRVVKPDLPGHGRAPWTGDYTLGSLAASVSATLEPNEPVVVVGHSLGGGVGLFLASGFFRPSVLAVVGIGIKVRWTDEEVSQMAGVAAKGIRFFGTRDEAVARFLRQAGLDGIVDADHPAVDGAIIDTDQGWRVTQDPMTFAQQPLDMPALMSAASAPVVLGAGELDTMVSAADLAPFVDDPRIAIGRGHNVHVEDPAWLTGLVLETTGMAAVGRQD